VCISVRLFAGVKQGSGGGFVMTDIRTEDKRTGADDRRTLGMDRRQFIDISWQRDKERRLAEPNRRQGAADRRE
jgi:hypothetical protein